MTARHDWCSAFEATLERLPPLPRISADDRPRRRVATEQYRHHALRDPHQVAQAYHRAQLHAAEFPPADADNGCLAYVPGEALGAPALPDAATSQVERAALEVDGGGFGRFRVCYMREEIRSHQSSHWVWMPYWAERIG